MEVTAKYYTVHRFFAQSPVSETEVVFNSGQTTLSALVNIFISPKLVVQCRLMWLIQYICYFVCFVCIIKVTGIYDNHLFDGAPCLS